MNARPAWIAAAGQKLFGYRLVIGLLIVLIALEWLEPAPLFQGSYLLPQVFGLILVLGGLSLRAWGSGTAGGHTRSSRIEAPSLITGGPFAYMRNPIYGGTILLGVGMVLIIGDPRAFLFAMVAFVVLYTTIIPAEEDFLLRQFGNEYVQYRTAVPQLLPRLTPWQHRKQTSFHWPAIKGEFVIGAILVAIYLALIFEEYLDHMGRS